MRSIDNRTYLQQCLKATELQADYFSGKIEKFDTVTKQWEVSDAEQDAGAPQFTTVWVPRQEQLQALVWDYTHSVVFWQLNDVINFTSGDFVGSAETFEQCWLMIYMYEVYNKIWDNATREWESRG
jgi:hypothetical protein